MIQNINQTKVNTNNKINFYKIGERNKNDELLPHKYIKI